MGETTEARTQLVRKQRKHERGVTSKARNTHQTVCRFSLWGLLVISSTEDDSSYKATLHAPHWLLRKVWEAHATKEWGGWQFTLRVQNRVPLGSPVIKCIDGDDVLGLLRLFRDRKASPYDTTPYGTLLEVSIVSYTGTCELGQLQWLTKTNESWHLPSAATRS